MIQIYENHSRIYSNAAPLFRIFCRLLNYAKLCIWGDRKSERLCPPGTLDRRCSHLVGNLGFPSLRVAGERDRIQLVHLFCHLLVASSKSTVRIFYAFIRRFDDTMGTWNHQSYRESLPSPRLAGVGPRAGYYYPEVFYQRRNYDIARHSEHLRSIIYYEFNTKRRVYATTLFRNMRDWPSAVQLHLLCGGMGERICTAGSDAIGYPQHMAYLGIPPIWLGNQSCPVWWIYSFLSMLAARSRAGFRIFRFIVRYFTNSLVTCHHRFFREQPWEQDRPSPLVLASSDYFHSITLKPLPGGFSREAICHST